MKGFTGMVAGRRSWYVSAIAVGAFIITISTGVLVANAVTSDGESSSEKTLQANERPAKSDFPTNENGLTYGSDAAAEPGEGPDLVAVVGDSGTHGYVRARDLDGPDFKSPEEALAWQEQHPGDVTIDVFDSSGEKVIDTFTLKAAGVAAGG